MIPVYGTFPFGDNRNFKDTRTFVGLYVNEQWTPVKWFTLTLGGREDFTKESLDVFQQEIGDDEFEEVHDESNVNRFSWGVAGMFHIVDRPDGGLTGMSLYGAARRNFKPAAPNLTEAENAEILDPETTNTQEAGLKTLWLDGKLSVNVTWFHMIFSNLVVGVLTPDGPALTNAGKVRFQGTEVEIGYALPFVDYLSLYGGYAYHDSRFKEFTFFTPDGEFRDVAGKQLELDPRNFWNFKFVLAPPQGFGGLRRAPSPEPPASEPAQHVLHAVVLPVRRRALVRVQLLPALRDRPQPDQFPALHDGERDRRQPVLREPAARCVRAAHRQLLARVGPAPSSLRIGRGGGGDRPVGTPSRSKRNA